MINEFLKAKHWLIMLLTFGVPVLFILLLIGRIKSDEMLVFESFFISFLILVVFFGWLYSAGVGLNRIIPNEYKLKVTRFKISLSVPLLFIVVISYWLYNRVNGNPIPLNFELIFSFHLLSMFCLFYCFYFVARAIRTAEMKKKVSFTDFVGLFFLIWFFPIGIWFVQPRINRVIEE